MCPATHTQAINEVLPPAELVSAGHVRHCPAPGATLYVPAPHAVHAAPSADPAYPATHLQEFRAFISPAELVPAGHREHCPTPVGSLYVPASHGLHAAPSDTPLYPAKHLQEFRAVLPNAELVPTGQIVHSPAPAAALYPPTSHAVHIAPSNVPLYPAKHLQSVDALLPDAELVPAGHDVHAEEPATE